MTLRSHGIALAMAAATFAAAPAAVAEEVPPTDVVACSDQAGDATALEEARLANVAARQAFTSLRGPMSQEIRAARAAARADAKAARAELRGSSAEAAAARAELRAAKKTLKASNAALAKQVKVERKATKAEWDEVKAAYHALLEAYELCYGSTDEPEDEVDDTDGTDGTDGD